MIASLSGKVLDSFILGAILPSHILNKRGILKQTNRESTESRTARMTDMSAAGDEYNAIHTGE